MWTDIGHVSHNVHACKYFKCCVHATDTYKHRAYHGQGNGTIWLDDVQCDGTEERLLDCRATPIGEHNCGHHEDVGVVCSGN